MHTCKNTRAHRYVYIYIYLIIYIYTCIIYIVYAPGKDNPWLWHFRCYFYHKHLWPQNFQLSTAQPLTFPAGGRIEWDWMSVPRAGTLTTINSLGHAWPLGPGISEMFSHDSCEHPEAWFLELIEPELILGSVFQGHPSIDCHGSFGINSSCGSHICYELWHNHGIWPNCISWYLNNKRICIHLCSGITPELSTLLAHCDSAAIIIPGLSSGPWTMHHSEDFLHVYLQSNSGTEPLIGTIIQKKPKKTSKDPLPIPVIGPSPILIVTWSRAVLNTAPIPLSLQHHQLKPDLLMDSTVYNHIIVFCTGRIPIFVNSMLNSTFAQFLTPFLLAKSH